MMFAGSGGDAVLGGVMSECRRGVNCGADEGPNYLTVSVGDVWRETELTSSFRRKHGLYYCLPYFLFSNEILQSV
jgi:hypothetical protein